jgi:NADPH-dependent ferric siderophore reductase
VRAFHELFTVPGTVVAVERSAGRMRRVVIECAPLNWTPGQQVHVHIGNAERSYSVWRHAGTRLELQILDHGGDGPGARWGRTVSAGEPVRMSKPVGNLVLRKASHHLFVGDETAQVAFGPMLAALAEGAEFRGVVEVDRPADRLPLRDGLIWRYRCGDQAVASATLVEAVRALPLPENPGVAYIAGEARTVQLVRRHLVHDRGWPRRSVLVKPFWAPGRTGLQ